MLSVSASTSTCNRTQVFRKSQGQGQFSKDPRRCVFTITYLPKYVGSLPFPSPNHTTIKCLSFHGPHVSPGSRAGGVSSAGQVSLGYETEEGPWMLVVPGMTPPLEGSWPGCHPAWKGSFSSPPQPWGGWDCQRHTTTQGPLRRLPARQAVWLSQVIFSCWERTRTAFVS